LPLPTGGNVHGWLWFYFVNEQFLRYLNLRIPRDYDIVPLWLFWGLILIWTMPWSAFLFKAAAQNFPTLTDRWRRLRMVPFKVYLRIGLMQDAQTKKQLLLQESAIFPLLFFSLSTRQEYYALPAFPAIVILIAGWLAHDSRAQWKPVTLAASRLRLTNLRITAFLLVLGTLFATASLIFLLHGRSPSPDIDLDELLQQNPGNYALSMGHFLDLNLRALDLFRLPLLVAAISLFLGPAASYLLRRRNQPHAATLTLAAGAFGFLLAAHLGLQIFAPVLSSAQLAAAIAPQLRPDDLIVIHQEYEYGSTLGFYLKRPSYSFYSPPAYPGGVAHPIDWPRVVNPIHILEGRSSNLWYGSFFPDAPQIFESPQSLAEKWAGPQRIFLWQDLGNQPSPLTALPEPIYVIAKSGGKEIVSNQPNQP
jgi:hypothetical protein